MATRKAATKKKSTTKNPDTGAESLNRVGALWLSEDKNGKKFFSGKISLDDNSDPVSVLVFRNTYKKKDNQPDYIIYMPETNDESAEREAAAKKWQDDDIPF
jgi:hypothetical protein